MKKVIIINGSPRNDNISNTYKALMAEKDFFIKNNGNDIEFIYYKIPKNFQGCINCEKCDVNCNIKDSFQQLVEDMEDATDVILGSPVYLDMPTPQTMALLTRLNCKAENTDRNFFKNKKIHLLTTAYCSGTKSAIHSMMGACEMLGFTIEGRSTREYISLWKDKKLRGGLTRQDTIFLE